ncbi:site-specific DNA-methyltransferase [Pseudonocardia eucalypti]|uniref:Methyltransferase n=1 Tax=Pseudonocardia eucalypti TaxID=648755 RepID=A0ABP9Q847_9PSEU|nr:DNA modification methylase [Pseudonocardia eucalypti]
MSGAAGDAPRRQFLCGDAVKRLRGLPEASIDCVITSPPYWAQRDYGVAGQIGAEPTVQGWVTELVGVAAELRRVLKPGGALWLNIGDGYSRHPREGAPRKSLLLGPQRLAVALQEDGWLVRNNVIWAKRNAMPSSVTDRLSCSHETILLLTQQPTYYFDLDAIRVPATTPRHSGRATQRAVYPPPAAAPQLHGSPRIDLNRGLASLKAAGQESHPLGKNPGDAWLLPTAAYRGAHFAVFPLDLVRRPLLATCPERLCTGCGVPWRRAQQRVNGRLLASGPLRAGCDCGGDWRPGIVLDPFMGAGTVALVAEQERRDWLGIELNPAYVELAQARLAQARGHP